eukprot:scaffold8526_cov100-Isochrysis_galbana.AAC.4
MNPTGACAFCGTRYAQCPSFLTPATQSLKRVRDGASAPARPSNGGPTGGGVAVPHAPPPTVTHAHEPWFVFDTACIKPADDLVATTHVTSQGHRNKLSTRASEWISYG